MSKDSTKADKKDIKKKKNNVKQKTKSCYVSFALPDSKRKSIFIKLN